MFSCVNSVPLVVIDTSIFKFKHFSKKGNKCSEINGSPPAIEILLIPKLEKSSSIANFSSSVSSSTCCNPEFVKQCLHFKLHLYVIS